MKEFYAVKDAAHKEIFKSYSEAIEFLKTLTNGKIKGFYTEKDAIKWVNKPVKDEGIFVVFAGRVPGIYFTVADMKAQVEGFEGALVGKANDIKKAEMLFASRERIVAEGKKRERGKKNPEIVRAQKVANLKRLQLKCKGDVLCFIDCEANEGKAISIGAVVYDNVNKMVIDTYYSLMQPTGFVKLDSYIEKLTKLTTEEIAGARKATEVNKEFIAFLSAHNVSDIFSWSGNDKSFLNKNGKGFGNVFNTIKDLQPYVSAITVDEFYCPRWSLENMMYIFDIGKKVEHNALSDAMDLCEVFKRWTNNEAKKERIFEIIDGRQ